MAHLKFETDMNKNKTLLKIQQFDQQKWIEYSRLLFFGFMFIPIDVLIWSYAVTVFGEILFGLYVVDSMHLIPSPQGAMRVLGIVKDGGFHHLRYQKLVFLIPKERGWFIKEGWYIKYSRLPNLSMKMCCLKCMSSRY
jgi:hypothetical protein